MEPSARIKIAFYKGRGDWRNKIIRWWTKSLYSHAELVLPDNKTWLSISPILTSRVSAREKTEHDPEKWDFLEFEVSSEQLQIISNFFDDTKGCQYDWIGMIASQFLPFAIKRREKWYCSEWIAYALRIAGVFHWREIKIYDRCDLSPGVLYRIAKDSLTKQRKDCIMKQKTYASIPEALADGYSIQQLRKAIEIKKQKTAEPQSKIAEVKASTTPAHPGVESGFASYGSPFYDPACDQSLSARSAMQNVDPFGLVEPITTQRISTGAYDEDLHGWIYEKEQE